MINDSQTPEAAVTPLENTKVRSSLKLSLLEGFLYSIMVGTGETYLPAFAMSVGTSEILVGMLASVPLLIGAVVQLLSPRAISYVGSHKKWVVITASIQAFAFLPLLIFAWMGQAPFWALMVCSSIYWGSGFASGPAWNFWMGHLVPRTVSSSYFSQRVRYTQVGVLLGLVTAGLVLQRNSESQLWPIFSSIFFVAFICRIVSAYFLAKQDVHPDWEKLKVRPSIRVTLRKLLQNPEQKKFFVALFLFYAGVYISAPFVTPYMLAQLKFSYQQYMCALAILILAKVGSASIVKKWIDVYGVRKVFLFGAFAAAPVPILWNISPNFYYILFLQLTSGVAWGAFEVGMTLIFFNNIPSHAKTTMLALHNVFNSCAIVFGGFVGGKILYYFGLDHKGYWMIFTISTVMRFVFLIPFVKNPIQVIKYTPYQLIQFWDKTIKRRVS